MPDAIFCKCQSCNRNYYFTTSLKLDIPTCYIIIMAFVISGMIINLYGDTWVAVVVFYFFIFLFLNIKIFIIAKFSFPFCIYCWRSLDRLKRVHLEVFPDYSWVPPISALIFIGIVVSWIFSLDLSNRVLLIEIIFISLLLPAVIYASIAIAYFSRKRPCRDKQKWEKLQLAYPPGSKVSGVIKEVIHPASYLFPIGWLEIFTFPAILDITSIKIPKAGENISVYITAYGNEIIYV